MVRPEALPLCLSLASILGCSPELVTGDSLVTGPRLLAVRAAPAEAAPKGAVAMEALYVDPSGPRTTGSLDWAFCLARKPIAEPGSVSTDCLVPSSPDLVPLGAGATVDGALPDDACRLFGPDLPEPKAGEPAGRPADPDLSGGYYQPARVRIVDELGERYVVAATRLTCGISGATPEIAATYKKQYRTNENPRIEGLTLTQGTEKVELVAQETDPTAVATVRAGVGASFDVRWADCPDADTCGDGLCGIDDDTATCAEDCTAPIGCSGAERYLSFDQETRALAERREGILVSWFATGGTFEVDRTGRTEDEAASSTSDDGWTPPEGAEDVRVWVVLRDDRGGAGWSSYRLTVIP